ncbi:MAG: 50S ribosomal protein L17 [Acholeplasmatales bacterium]|jgi:large subunit ribosomal protein L17|nr:50S ribosomal protein L17 [Acholeplasmatales bacterium]
MAYSKLRRTSDQRKALLRDLVTDLIINEKIITTQAKAKELEKAIAKVITLAKRGDLAARRQVAETVRFEQVTKDQNALQKLFDVIAPRYKDTKGGFTRIIKTVPRRGDAAEMAIINLI